jgi:hypothetical protein
MPPAASMVSTACRVSAKTARWPSLSPGLPMVRPNGYSIAARRGTHTAAVKSGMLDRVMVVIPASSIARCASPTDQQQIGQAGTSTTTSTPSS